MRKAILGSVGVILLTVGVVIGWFAGAQSRSAARPVAGADGSASPENPVPDSTAPGTRYRAGDPGLLAPAPSWEEWKYPDSRVHKAGNAGKASVGKIEVSGVDRVALVSKDDFDKVWTFYRDKGEQKVLAAGRTPLAVQGHEWEGDKKVLTVALHDRHYACATEGPESDLLQVKGFWVRSLRYRLAGFIYRAKGSDSTGILLFSHPSSEFTGLLKGKSVEA
jgi:hypothetical protein